MFHVKQKKHYLLVVAHKRGKTLAKTARIQQKRYRIGVLAKTMRSSLTINQLIPPT